jgi:tetratricopeptide (TPR) repeat protein
VQINEVGEMTETQGVLCGDEAMRQVLVAAERDAQQGADIVDVMLADYPGDPRLHFLKGSLLIGLQRFIEAHGALSRAMALAPDYHIARFQLGLFELTSGEPDAALATWAPLRDLPPGHALATFAAGLEYLIADRFEACIAKLREGIAANDENQPLNRDMELVIAQCEQLLAARAPPREDANEPGAVSATSFLLRGLKD